MVEMLLNFKFNTVGLTYFFLVKILVILASFEIASETYLKAGRNDDDEPYDEPTTNLRRAYDEPYDEPTTSLRRAHDEPEDAVHDQD